ncbi:unnamed protein product [Schistosoma rodhaini]|nr:unnamed protein product [Schistosoma rodhaini]
MKESRTRLASIGPSRLPGCGPRDDTTLATDVLRHGSEYKPAAILLRLSFTLFVKVNVTSLTEIFSGSIFLTELFPPLLSLLFHSHYFLFIVVLFYYTHFTSFISSQPHCYCMTHCSEQEDE